MPPSKRAPRGLIVEAQRMIDESRHDMKGRFVHWLPQWQVELLWQDCRAYGMLLYRCQGGISPDLMAWLEDAFARAYGQTAVVRRTLSSIEGAICFGGAPDAIPLPKAVFPDVRSTESVLPIHPIHKKSL